MYTYMQHHGHYGFPSRIIFHNIQYSTVEQTGKLFLQGKTNGRRRGKRHSYKVSSVQIVVDMLYNTVEILFIQKQRERETSGKTHISVYESINSLIGLLKLSLFCKVAVHIFENSAFRNPFIPAAKNM